MRKRIIILSIIWGLALPASAGMASGAIISTELPKDLSEIYYSVPEEKMITVESVVPNARIIYDLPYCGELSTPYQKLHLVLPEGDDSVRHPVLVVVHGGNWMGGNSSEHMVQFTDRAGLWALYDGYAVALVDYSIRNEDNETALPNQIYEIKAAVRYLRSVADEYSLDADKIALLGESAGGHLVNMAGVTNGEPQYDLEAYGNMEYSSDVQAVIGQYSLDTMEYETDSTLTSLCGTDVSEMDEEARRELLAQISPIDHVDAADPPFYLEHGISDHTVPFTQSCEFFKALVDAGSEKSELHLYPGMDHAVAWFQTEECARGFIDWLDKIFLRAG